MENSHQLNRHHDQLQARWESTWAGCKRALNARALLQSPENHIHHWVLSLLLALGRKKIERNIEMLKNVQGIHVAKQVYTTEQTGEQAQLWPQYPPQSKQQPPVDMG